jgi:serine/threonine-protein kinase HipA
MQYKLRVQAEGDDVGMLSYDAAEELYQFEYIPGWQSKPGAFPLSPNIPLRGVTPARSGVIQRFLANQLPEGRALDVASTAYQISKSNIFGLTRRLGQEPTGALSFLPASVDTLNTATMAPIRRPITEGELTERIRDRDTIPFPVWDGRVRLSVAGYQDKLQVMVEGEQLSLVEHPLSSTHILKPESRNPHTPFMVANEHFCMTLAAMLELPVAAVEIRRTPEPVLLIERFDRIVQTSPEDKGRVIAVTRRHIIDACQALDLPVDFKYERNFGHAVDVPNIRDGVSFEKVFSLQSHFDNPAVARTFIIRWALLQLLIGNSNAHGKNLSFFQTGAGLSPAPMYDLVSVNVYGNNVEQEMAMAYGDAFRLDEIGAFQLADFGHRAHIRPALLSREVTRLANAALARAPALSVAEIYTVDEKRFLADVVAFITKQAQDLLRIAPMIPQVDPDML